MFLCCFIGQRRQTTLSGCWITTRPSTWRWGSDSVSLRRSTSTMWTTTCPLLTCRSTAGNVSDTSLISTRWREWLNEKWEWNILVCWSTTVFTVHRSARVHSSNGQYLIHGSECGRPGADGPDGHIWPGGSRCVSELGLWSRGWSAGFPATRCRDYFKTTFSH